MGKDSLMEHFERPRNVGEIPSPDAEAHASEVAVDAVRSALRGRRA